MTLQIRWALVVCSALALLGCDKLLPKEYPKLRLDASVLLDATLPPVPRRDAAAADGATASVPMSLVVPQCGPRPSADVAFSKAALLQSVGECARYRYCDFQAYQLDLTQKVAALRTAPSEQTRRAARDAWQFANASWQRAELFRFGPAGTSGDPNEPGGRDLRSYIESFPLFDRCVVDAQTVSKLYADASFATTSSIAGRTLPALEYLLFDEGLQRGCLTNENAGEWSALGASELEARKLAYAEAVTRDLDARAKALVDAWDPAKENFLAQLSTAGRGSQLFPTEQMALSAVGASLFYLDKELKDSKLEKPLGLNMDCGEQCRGRFESPFAQASTLNIRQNLAGFRELFQGCGENNQGLGIADWLAAIGAQEAAERMLTLLSTAEQLAQELDGPLDQADPASVVALKDAVKQMTMVLRADIVTKLDINLPMYAEGDND